MNTHVLSDIHDLPEEVGMPQKKATRGPFTITPDVLMMTCDLPDGVNVAFNRLCCQTKFNGYTFYGSVRKFGLLARFKRDKADRNLRALKKAGLITVEEMTGGITIYKLNMEELWELNKAYHDGIPIPPWKNLQVALEGVRKIRQAIAEEQKSCPKNQTRVSEKSDKGVRDSGKSVRCPVLEAPPKKEESKKIPKEKREKEETPSVPSTSLQFSPEEQRVLDWFCEREAKPVDMVLAKKRCAAISVDIKTREQFLELHAIAAKKVQGKEDSRPNLGNIESALPIWRNERQQAEDQWWVTSRSSKDDQHEEVRTAEPTTDEIPVVLPELPQRQRNKGMSAGAAEHLAEQIAEHYPGLVAQFGEIRSGCYLLYIWYGDLDDEWFALDLVAWWNLTPESELQRLLDQAALYAASNEAGASLPVESEVIRECSMAL